MSTDAKLSTALAILGAIFWSIQLLPQILLNHIRGMEQRRLEREHQQLSLVARSGDASAAAESDSAIVVDHWVGLQPSMMLLWAGAGLFLSLHNILSAQHPALIAQAHILSLFSLVTWAQVMFFSPSHPTWTIRKTLFVCLVLVLAFAGVELAFVVGFHATSSDSHSRSPKALILTLASLSAAGLGLGVLRHYVDAIAHRSVRGISWMFVLLDAAGDVASLASVLLGSPSLASSSQTGSSDAAALGQERNAAVAIYATELALWIGLMALGLLCNAPPAIGRQTRARRGTWSATWSRFTFAATRRRMSTSMLRTGREGRVTQHHIQSPSDQVQLDSLAASPSPADVAAHTPPASIHSTGSSSFISTRSLASQLSRRSGTVFRTAAFAAAAQSSNNSNAHSSVRTSLDVA